MRMIIEQRNRATSSWSRMKAILRAWSSVMSRTSVAGSGLHLPAWALEAAGTYEFDLVLLDVMLPGIDGLEVCRRLRARQQYMPVLMLTARSSETDKVLGLETGAVDCLTKPFDIHKLLARIKAIFRRMDALAAPRATPERVIEVPGCLRINPATREVFMRGQPIVLTHREFDRLQHFA